MDEPTQDNRTQNGAAEQERDRSPQQASPAAGAPDHPRQQPSAPPGAEARSTSPAGAEPRSLDESSALAVAVGDTAEITALDPSVDHLADVANPSFPTTLRGYDRAAVDAYVAHVTQVVTELQAVRSPRAAVKKALARVGDETTAILQRAQEAADEITAESRARADGRVRRAEREAGEIVGDAHEQVRRLDADTEALWRERRRLIEDVRRTADDLHRTAVEALKRFPAEDETADPVTPARPVPSPPAAKRKPPSPTQPTQPPQPAPPAPPNTPGASRPNPNPPGASPPNPAPPANPAPPSGPPKPGQPTQPLPAPDWR